MVEQSKCNNSEKSQKEKKLTVERRKTERNDTIEWNYLKCGVVRAWSPGRHFRKAPNNCNLTCELILVMKMNMHDNGKKFLVHCWFIINVKTKKSKSTKQYLAYELHI